METTENRELRTTGTFKVPVELMWEAWSNSKHIAHWWGPEGFTNTIQVMDFREGGEWRFTMHSPDGKDFANRSIFKEIVPNKKIVFEHFNPHFITTVFFTEKGPDTEIEW